MELLYSTSLAAGGMFVRADSFTCSSSMVSWTGALFNC